MHNQPYLTQQLCVAGRNTNTYVFYELKQNNSKMNSELNCSSIVLFILHINNIIIETYKYKKDSLINMVDPFGLYVFLL